MAGGASIGPRIQVDGEEQYRQQIRNIIEQSKTLDAEMKALAATFTEETSAQDKARQSQRNLNDQLDLARERTRLVREMTQKAAETTEENSTQTLKWRQALAAAEEQQAKLERAVLENNKAINDQGEATEDAGQKMATLGDQVAGLADRFGIHLPDSIKGALDNVNGFSTGTVAAMGAAAAAVGGVTLGVKAVSAGIEAAKKLNEMTLEQAHWADDLLTKSAQTGLDTTLLQQLDYASKFLDFDGIDKSLVKLTASMDSARDGAEKQTAAFETLGVSVTGTDGELRNNWDTFKDVIDALGEVQNATERDALANDIFGKSYSELKPLIDAGSEGLQEFMNKAVEGGHVLDESQIQKLGEVDDAYQEYQTKLDDVKKKLVVEFAPVSIEVMETFGNLATQAGEKLAGSGILEKLGDFIEPLGEIGESLLNLADSVLPVATDLLNGLADAFAWAADKAAAFFDWLSRLDEETIQQTMVDAGDMGYWGDYNPAFAGYNAAGTPNWRGGLTWVGESGPELVQLPRGTQIYSNQESQQLAAAGTDTRQMERLMSEEIGLLRDIKQEFAGMRMMRRMIYG